MTLLGFRVFAARSSVALVLLSACSDPETSTPSACGTYTTSSSPSSEWLTQATLSITGDRAELRALVVDPDRHRIELAAPRRLELVSEDDKTVVAASFAPTATCASTYVAEASAASLGRSVTLRLVDGAETHTTSVQIAPSYAVANAPREVVVGKEAGLVLDRKFPSIGGGTTESWSVTLRGPCLTMTEKDEGERPLSRTLGVGGNGSAQATGQSLTFQLPADQLASGSTGCDAEAEFCSTLVGALGGDMKGLGTMPLVTRSCTTFTTHVRP